MREPCQLCGFETLEPAYGCDAASGPAVYICAHCGLTQSHRAAREGDTSASFIAQDEDTKALRVANTLALLSDYVDLSRPLSVLDVGAARGAFVRRFLSAAPGAFVTAVEPNENQAWACAFLDRSKVISKPVEDVALGDEQFDVVHSCRTLEHLDSPLPVLRDHWRILKPGGLLILDCRNIGAIRDEGIIDEWFGPNFRCHFSSVTLSRMLGAAGFDLIEPPDCNDHENISIAAVKSNHIEQNISADPLEVHSARALVAFYKFARQRNLSALRAIGAELTALAPKGVAICGSGRLLDLLLRYEDIDTKNFVFLSEGDSERASALHKDVAEETQRRLEDANPGIIVVMSDAQNDELARMASRLAPQAEIVHYSQLVFRAYNRRAA
jgi:SAM-dependent methyltransferase